MTLRIEHRRLVSRGDIPGSNGGIYNPGAVWRGGAILLLCRREIDYRFTPAVFPELLTFDPDTLELTDYRTLRTSGYPREARLEDFRCLAFRDLTLVAHSLVRRHRIKPVISVVDGHTLRPFDAFELPVDAARVEKNWVLFVHEGALHCLYKLDPLTIFVRSRRGTWRLVKRTDNGWAWQIAHTLSNSANLLPFEGGYLGFWHTTAEDRYVQGAYFLTRDLRLKYRTGVLLDGRDVRDGFKPGVLYVSSLLADDRRVLAFYGEGDAHTSVAIIDRQELWDALRRSPFRRRGALRIRYEGASMSDAFRAMRTLQAFSAQRGHPRIRLHVPDPRIRRTIRRLKTPNITLEPPSRERPPHCRLLGATGRFVWPGGDGSASPTAAASGPAATDPPGAGRTATSS